MESEQILQLWEGRFNELVTKYANHSVSVGILKGGEASYFHVGSPLNGEAAKDAGLISSMTKPITAIAIGLLVASKEISLYTKVEDIIPLRATVKHPSGTPLKIVDLLDHRTAWARLDQLWEGWHGNILHGYNDEEDLDLFHCLPQDPKYATEDAFQNQRNYLNDGYRLLQHVIKVRAAMTYERFVHEKIFKPLGMNDTTAKTEKQNGDANLAFCSIVNGVECQTLIDQGEDAKTTLDWFLNRVRAESPITDKQPVQPSKSSDGKTSITSAAGVVSTPSDFLKFVQLLMDVARGKPRQDVAELEEGCRVMWDYIQHMVTDDRCAYAGGWNPFRVPWDQLQRGPGADGENFGRVQGLMSLGHTNLKNPDIWPFFLPETSLGQVPRDHGFFHGGNMVGATSAVLFIPNADLAVVAICHARSFFVDAPNLIVLSLADSLYMNRSSAKIAQLTSQVEAIGEYCAAYYLYMVGTYCSALSQNYEKNPALVEEYAGCIGKYILQSSRQKSIFMEIQANAISGALEVRQQHEDIWHPLKVNIKTEVLTMTYAPTIEEAHASGLGGKHWLQPKSFELEFRGAENGKYTRLERSTGIDVTLIYIREYCT